MSHNDRRFLQGQLPELFVSGILLMTVTDLCASVEVIVSQEGSGPFNNLAYSFCHHGFQQS